MNQTTNNIETAQTKVADVVNQYKLVINKGSTGGIKQDQRFLVYTIGEEIFDPDTKESLGNLDIVRGTGRVIYVTALYAIIESDMKRNIQRSRRYSDTLSMFSKYMGGEEMIYETENIPFEDPRIGDLVKPV